MVRVLLEVLVLVVNINDVEDCFGGVVNVVINLFLLGVKVIFLGMIGNDVNVDVLEKWLFGYGIDCYFSCCDGFDIIIKF